MWKKRDANDGPRVVGVGISFALGPEMTYSCCFVEGW